VTLRVLSVASEAYPLIKTGGLADVVGALPMALAPYDVRMTTLLPGYPAVVQRLGMGDVLHTYQDLLGVGARLVRHRFDDLDLLILDAPDLYDRNGGPYLDPAGQDWADNWRRFAALSRCAADLAGGLVDGFTPDLVHAHDWQAALTPTYMRYGTPLAAHTPSVLTLHNLAFQGRYPADIFQSLGLPADAFSINSVEYFGGVGFLKAGLATASAITTVSPTYAEEIRDPAYGMGLEGMITARRDQVIGIINGIDTAVWDPAHDADLIEAYSAKTLSKRKANRRAVEDAFGLEKMKGPIFCVISRLTWQKGMDVLVELMDALIDLGGRMAVLGSGDSGLEAAFRAAAHRHPGRIGVRIGYDEALSHLLQGGADAIVIPSRFEPCGLTQLYGLRYGCVPIVARTGGLADTLIDANEAGLAAGVATGFQFDGVTHDSVYRALKRATQTYRQTKVWRALQTCGMQADFSWRRSGLRYAELYRTLVTMAAPDPSPRA
jgi:starch synthase